MTLFRDTNWNTSVIFFEFMFAGLFKFSIFEGEERGIEAPKGSISARSRITRAWSRKDNAVPNMAKKVRVFTVLRKVSMHKVNVKTIQEEIQKICIIKITSGSLLSRK